jgi:hypothetical protein
MKRTVALCLILLPTACASRGGGGGSVADPDTETIASEITTVQADSFFSDANRWNVVAAYSTIKYPDVNNDRHADVCGRRDDGVWCATDNGAGTLVNASKWNADLVDTSGWNNPQYYSTIQFPDLNNDGKADLCARGVAGALCGLSNGSGSFGTLTVWSGNFSDGAGWTAPQYYRTLQFPDVNGDGKADVCGRGFFGVLCGLNTGSDFGGAPPTWSSLFSDANGWTASKYYTTIRFPDLDGDGRADVCGRGPDAAGNVRIWCGLSNGSNGFAAPTAWNTTFGDPAWDDDQYDSTIQFADADGDGRDDLCGRGPGGGPGSQIGIWCALSNGSSGFGTPTLWNGSIGNATWNSAPYYGTIRVGKGFVCGRGSSGVYCAYSNGTSFKYQVLESPNESDANGWLNPQYYSTIAVPRDPKLMERGSAGIYSAPLSRYKLEEVTIGPAGKNMNYYRCGIDGETCAIGPGKLYMAYGANGSYVYKLLGGSVACGVSTFGSDPAPGVVKSCYFSNYGTSVNMPGTGLALENQSATADGNVAFGANGAFFFRTFHGSFTCNTATFGDPIVGVSKACYIAAPAYTRVASDGGSIPSVMNTPVAWGAGGKFVYMQAGNPVVDANQFTSPCATGVPGGFAYDPAPGVAKDCYKLTDGHAGTATTQLMANDDQNWTSRTGQVINTFYGSGRNGNFVLYSTNNSTGPCSALFGDPDPAVVKYCWNAPVPGPFAGTWTQLQNQFPETVGRAVEAAILMPDGSVMVNSIDQFTHWYRLSAGPSGGFVDGTWTQLPNSLLGRHSFPAAPLRDGRLLVCGGEFIFDQNGNFQSDGPYNQCEIFDPNSGANGTWTRTTDFAIPGQTGATIVDGVMAPLPNGKILVGGAYMTQSMEFDPAHAFDSLAWLTPETAHLPTGDTDNRPFCEGSFAQLQGGSVFLAEVGFSRYRQGNPSGTKWSAALSPPPQSPFGAFGCGGAEGEGGSALTLYDGRALVLGAFGNNAIFDPTTQAGSISNVKQSPQVFPGTFNVGNLGGTHEAGHTITPTGRALIAAHSENGFHKFLEYDAPSDTFFDVSFGADPVITETNNTNGGMVSQTLLPDGSVLVASSHDKSLYVYRPAGSQLTTFGRPSLSTITGPDANGVYTLTGTTLNGLTNGANRDDEGSSYTSFPVVSVTSGTTTRYAIITSVSTTSIAPNASVTVKFKAPRAGWPGHGTLTVKVSASGLASSNSKTITVP